MWLCSRVWGAQRSVRVLVTLAQHASKGRREGTRAHPWSPRALLHTIVLSINFFSITRSEYSTPSIWLKHKTVNEPFLLMQTGTVRFLIRDSH